MDDPEAGMSSGVGELGSSSRFAGRRVLFLDQGMLKDRHGKPIHGVELFRVRLVRQLMERGIHVAMALDSSWRKTIAEEFPDPKMRPECLFGPSFVKGTLLNGLFSTLRCSKLLGKRYDAVVFGNARRGLIPAVRLAKVLGLGKRRLVFAHRHPKGPAARAIAKAGVPVLCVSEDVALGFREAEAHVLGVHYGLPNVGRFTPASAEQRAARTDGRVRFVLLARLPNVSKGHMRAIEAFELLPADVRARCELHLASFFEPQDFGVDGVIAHTWKAPDEVPGFLRGMDVMLTISSNETFSQAIVQGMLTELPIIATPLPVYTEKLDPAEGGGGGVICETTEEIAEAMATYAGDAALRRRVGAEGRRVALDRYVWDTDRFLEEFLFPAEGGS